MRTRSQSGAGRMLPGAPLPLRVGFAGERGLRAFGGGVEVVALEGQRPDLRKLDVLVLDPHPAGYDRGRLEALVDDAAARSVTVIGLDADGVEQPLWGGLTDLVVGAGPEAELLAAPSLDPTVCNPRAFRDVDVAGFAAAVTWASVDEELGGGLELIAEVARDEPVVVLAADPAELPELPDGAIGGEWTPGAKGKGAVRATRSRLGAIDHPGFHASDWERAGWIAKLCASGLPVVAVEPSETLRLLLGEELATLIDELTVSDVTDLDRRERASVALRRVALRDHSHEERWRQVCDHLGIEVPGRPMVSVVFATRRQDWLVHGLAQIERQNYEPVELVACLHGDDFSDDVEDVIGAEVSCPVKVLRIDSELTLGDALNQGVEAAEGELITKMDDDDYYSVDHIWDLVLAIEYAEAQLVGKGAEFVYLAGVDLTLRRFMGDGESDHPRLAGGGLMARRAELRAMGGWQSRTRGEDTWIVKDFKRAGHTTYRCHGYGYILNRHGQDHTWNTFVDYFLVQSQREWRGLRLVESAVELR